MRLRARATKGTGLLALATWCLAPAVAAQTPSPSRLLLDSISAPAFLKVQMHCRDIGIQEFDSLGTIAGCMGKLGDTLFIAYRARDGAPLAMTKQFFVEPTRLRVAGDSIRLALSREFGPARHCQQTIWTGVHWDSWQWYIGALTIQVAANAQEEPPKWNHREYPWIGIQFARVKLPCNDWLPVAVPVD